MRDRIHYRVRDPKTFRCCRSAMLAVACFIVHYLSWQVRNRFLGHLPEMETICSGWLPRNIACRLERGRSVVLQHANSAPRFVRLAACRIG